MIGALVRTVAEVSSGTQDAFDKLVIMETASENFQSSSLAICVRVFLSATRPRSRSIKSFDLGDDHPSQ